MLMNVQSFGGIGHPQITDQLCKPWGSNSGCVFVNWRRGGSPCKGAGILISHLLCISDSYLIAKGPNSPPRCHTRKFNRLAWSSELQCEMKVFS